MTAVDFSPERCSNCGEWAVAYGWQDHVDDGGVVVEAKTFCDDCYTELRRRIRRGLEPDAPKLL